MVGCCIAGRRSYCISGWGLIWIDGGLVGLGFVDMGKMGKNGLVWRLDSITSRARENSHARLYDYEE